MHIPERPAQVPHAVRSLEWLEQVPPAVHILSPLCGASSVQVRSATGQHLGPDNGAPWTRCGTWAICLTHLLFNVKESTECVLQFCTPGIWWQGDQMTTLSNGCNCNLICLWVSLFNRRFMNCNCQNLFFLLTEIHHKHGFCAEI